MSIAMKPDDELRGAAFHEAGHVIVACEFGLPVGEIAIGYVFFSINFTGIVERARKERPDHCGGGREGLILNFTNWEVGELGG